MRPSVALRGGRLSKGAAPRTAECCLDRGPRFPKGFRGIIRSHDTLEGGSCAGVRRSAHKREVRRACMGADTQPSIVPHQIGAYKTGRRVAHGARTCRSSRRQLQHRPQGVSRLGGRRSHLLQPRKAIVRGRCRQQETGASRVSGRSGHRGIGSGGARGQHHAAGRASARGSTLRADGMTSCGWAEATIGCRAAQRPCKGGIGQGNFWLTAGWRGHGQGQGQIRR